MPITLANFTFHEPLTALSESLEELGGRDARAIRLQGVLNGFPTREALDDELERLLANASASEYVPLSLRPGRQFQTRRTAFKRELNEHALTAAFTLLLEAMPPWEESTTETLVNWFFAASGATKSCFTAGTLYTLPIITLEAVDTLINPSFSDGVRALTYLGQLEAGDELILDAPNSRVLLNGSDVTPYTQGLFPQIAAPSTTLTYTGHPDSTHAGTADIRYRDRWY